jgi:hypothetical protein
VLTVSHPPTWPAERAYVLDVVLGERLGLDVYAHAEERPDVEISDGTRSLRLADGLFATREDDWLTERSLPTLHEAGGLPALWSSGGEPDLLGGIFFLLTRYEELVRDERDAHGRFPGSAATHPVERPLADEYVERLRERLEQTFPGVETQRPAFRVQPSHDVDVPLGRDPRLARTLRAAALDVAKRREPALAARRLRAFRTRRPDDDTCNTFPFLLAASERRGLRSTFYVMAGATDPARDGGYSLEAPWLQRLLRELNDRGHELGLHPSYGTFRDEAAIAGELGTLRGALERAGAGTDVAGGRQHYLRWEPETWARYARAGLAHDASVGFADRPGFRAGTCFDYPAFDLRARAVLPVRERPLVAMEASFLQYLGLSHARAHDRLVELKRACRRVGGTFTFLWHNNRLQTARDRALYEAVLDA